MVVAAARIWAAVMTASREALVAVAHTEARAELASQAKGLLAEDITQAEGITLPVVVAVQEALVAAQRVPLRMVVMAEQVCS